MLVWHDGRLERRTTADWAIVAGKRMLVAILSKRCEVIGLRRLHAKEVDLGKRSSGPIVASALTLGFAEKFRGFNMFCYIMHEESVVDPTSCSNPCASRPFYNDIDDSR